MNLALSVVVVEACPGGKMILAPRNSHAGVAVSVSGQANLQNKSPSVKC